MHKIVFEIATIDDWYMIIKECKNWFGTNWSGQKGVRKKFQKTQWIMSSHKVGGPKGVGAVFLQDEAKIDPLIRGGMQEMGYRAGTENFTLIAAFSEAIKQ